VSSSFAGKPRVLETGVHQSTREYNLFQTVAEVGVKKNLVVEYARRKHSQKAYKVKFGKISMVLGKDVGLDKVEHSLKQI
jgi:hypothetical protein